MTKKKISIVGVGIGGIATAMAVNSDGRHLGIIEETEKIDVYYDASFSIEKVGQGTTVSFSREISATINSDWYHNNIKSTPKTGILYENWGTKQKDIFHPFPYGSCALHYDPSLLSKEIFQSNNFNLIEKNINSLDDIDADYIFDCRGKHLNNPDDYNILSNPLNSVLCHRKLGRDYNIHYTKTVATPDGWCFVIPTSEYVSYGYLYNNTITSKEQASKNFKEMFDATVDFDLNFDNYIAKNVWQDERVILNGNRFCFIEPMEATSGDIYHDVATQALFCINGEMSKKEMNNVIYDIVKEIEMFILWHYQFGSVYNTPFWKYAKTIPFTPNEKFKNFIEYSKQHSYENLIKNTFYQSPEDIQFGQWTPASFKVWMDGVGI